MYCLNVGVDYTYININALAQGIKSVLASQVWFQAVAGARTYDTDSPAINTSHANHSATELCMYVCMYICMYVYVYVYICVCMYVCLYMCVCMYVCIYVYVCMYVCMSTLIHPSIRLSIFLSSTYLPINITICSNPSLFLLNAEYTRRLSVIAGSHRRCKRRYILQNVCNKACVCWQLTETLVLVDVREAAMTHESTRQLGGYLRSPTSAASGPLSPVVSVIAKTWTSTACFSCVDNIS